jgi:hypothetical protein
LPEGIQHLEKAMKHMPGDHQLFLNLGKAYILTGEADGDRARITDLEKINPRFSDIADLKMMLNRMN